MPNEKKRRHDDDDLATQIDAKYEEYWGTRTERRPDVEANRSSAETPPQTARDLDGGAR